MTALRIETAPTSLIRQEVERIYGANAPLSREAAAEILKARGVLPPGADGKPVYRERDLTRIRELIADPDVDPQWKRMLERSLPEAERKS